MLPYRQEHHTIRVRHLLGQQKKKNEPLAFVLERSDHHLNVLVVFAAKVERMVARVSLNLKVLRLAVVVDAEHVGVWLGPLPQQVVAGLLYACTTLYRNMPHNCQYSFFYKKRRESGL